MFRYQLGSTAVLFAILGSTAYGDLYRFDVSLDGLQVSVPVATPGYGTATAYFDDITREMTITGTFSDLIGTSTLAHLHGFSPAGVDAPVLIDLSLDVGVHSGSFSGYGILNPGTYPNGAADTLNGLTYIYVHSTFNPGGEIRGQLVDPMLVPEPASLMLFGGLSCVALVRRRRSMR